MRDALLLVPVPRRLVIESGEFLLSGQQLILIDHEQPQELLFSALRLQSNLELHAGLDLEVVASRSAPAGLIGVTLRVSPGTSTPPQGYELIISPQGVVIDAPQPAGLFYGVCTLIQIVERCGASLPCLRVQDWPDFPARGVMLDVSRDRVPAMDTLFKLVDRLAGWKINQLQLYTEHAFSYRQHAEVWSEASPITGQEVMLLDAFCRERFIELVPNQQSLGHLERWLNRPSYRRLAEVTDGFETPWGRRKGSFSLSPIDPRSIEFLRGLYAELLPHFSSRMFNIGCDETWDLGQGRSKEACEQLGKGQVYFDFLLQLFGEVKSFGKTPQFWGDIIVEDPELAARLPKDIVALEWGYEAGHPFDKHSAQYEALEIPFYVCPGTSSWCSLSGRSDNAVANLRNAAENGMKHGAQGYLIADWGDYGHWQVWPVADLGLMTGSACAWSLESSRDMEIARTLSWRAFGDASGSMGKAVIDLGNIYQMGMAGHDPGGIELHNSSLLFWMMQWPLEEIRAYPRLSPGMFEKTLQAVESAWGSIEAARLDCPDAELVRSEFRVTAQMLRHACYRGLLALENDPSRAESYRRKLDAGLTELVDEFRQVWLARNRVGGLSESVARLEKLHFEYIRSGKQ